MNSKKAKKIRKKIYGDVDFKDYYEDRKYAKVVSKTIRVPGPTPFSSKIIKKITIQADSKRQEYQRAKKSK